MGKSEEKTIAVLIAKLDSLEEQIKNYEERAEKIAAEQAVKYFLKLQKDERKERHDRRLHNIKMLLQNYRMLKLNSDEAVYSLDQIESPYDIFEDMMQGKDGMLQIDSIKKSAARTKIIVEHVEKMLDLYLVYATREDADPIEKRRYDVLYDLYLSDVRLNAKEIAEKNGISKESVYSDRAIALESMAALVFGVDGLTAR